MKIYLDHARKCSKYGFFIHFLVPPSIPATLKQQPLQQGELIKNISTYEKELLGTTNGSKDVAQKDYEPINIEEMIEKGAHLRCSIQTLLTFNVTRKELCHRKIIVNKQFLFLRREKEGNSAQRKGQD